MSAPSYYVQLYTFDAHTPFIKALPYRLEVGHPSHVPIRAHEAIG